MEIRISRNLYIILTIDVILLLLSFYVAHLIRFDFMIPEWALEKFFNMLPYVLVVKTFCFYFFDLYRGMWRYTSLNDLLNVVKASTIAELIVIVIVLYVNRFQDVSRSVFIIDWCLTLIFIAALRVLTRIIFEQFTENISFQDLKEIILNIFKIRSKNSRGVIIIGAGDCGEKICREIREDASLKYHVDGFLDDDLSKIGRKIHGISVLDKIEGLSHAIKSTESKEAIIAIPSLKVEKMRQIVNICREADIIFKTVPSMGELINGKVTINLIRDVEYRDLLGRDPVDLEKEKIGQYLGKKKVIVTGGGGSIGRELCKQICKFNPEKIILFERAETPLYEIDLELKKDFPDIEILPILGDIQNKDEIESLLKDIWSACPDIENFHIDNVSPRTIVKHKWGRDITKLAVKYFTEGNITAFGAETFDPKIIEINNLNSEQKITMKAIEIVNEYGSERGPNGMPKLLPGLNLLFGLPGETKKTHEINMKCLKKIYDDGLMLRRINIRRVVDYGGTKLSEMKKEMSKTKRNQKYYWKWRNDIRQNIDNPMLKRIAPEGLILKNLITEIYDGNITFARHLGTYPLIVGIKGRIPLNKKVDVKITKHQLRSLTGEVVKIH